MKDDRELLTRRIICDKLTWECKRSIGISLIGLFLGLIIFGMLNLIWSMALSTNVGILKFIPLLLYIPIFFVCAFSLIRALIRMSTANSGKFIVTEEILSEIRDNEFSLIQLILYGGRHTLFGNKSHLRHVFKFESGKSFIASVEEYKNTRLGTAAEYSVPGDHFFVVCYNSSPEKIVLLFSAKTYNYSANS